MSELPPPVQEDQFKDLEGATEEQVRHRAKPYILKLHAFLNHGSCLRDIQSIRRRWKPGVRGSRAFKNFATSPEHWYTFSSGGRNEPQFNIALSPDRLRIGLGFESTKKMYGDPEAVQEAFGRFTHVLKEYRPGFAKFVEANSLQVEWLARGGRRLEYVPANDVLEWLLNPPEPFPEWIFVGKLLYRGADSVVLEDSVRLRRIMEAVFKGFLHPWEEAQVQAQR